MTDFSATNSDTEPYRYDRLVSVWTAVLSFVHALRPEDARTLALMVDELNDHKGVLTVTWRNAEARYKFKGLFEQAWTWSGEHEDAVEHELLSQ